MCGRIGYYHDDRDLLQLVDVVNPEALAIEPRYNIAPTELLTLIFQDARGAWRAGRARWGLVPHWAKHPSNWKAATFNARSEELETKPTFRDAFKRGRVLIPASGYYEWRTQANGPKIPHFVRDPRGSPLIFAGLMDVWRSRDGRERLVSCTIAGHHLACGYPRKFVVEGKLWLDIAYAE